MPSKGDRSQAVGSVRIALLADERVTTQPGLNANLVPPAGVEPDFEEGRVSKRLECPVVAGGVGSLRVSRVSLLLDERRRVPHEPIAPCSRRRIRMPVHDRPVHALRLTALELGLQPPLRDGIFCEDDETGRVLVDSVNHERPPASGRSQVHHYLVVHGRHVSLAFEGYAEYSSRLVHNEQCVVFVHDVEIAAAAWESGPPGGAGLVDPHANRVVRGESRRRVRGHITVEVHLSAFDSCRRSRA
jgi:hypothetical protein